MEKRPAPSFRFTREYSERQKHGKHLNVVMLDCNWCTVGRSLLLFYTMEGSCSLKVSEAGLRAGGHQIELLLVQEESE